MLEEAPEETEGVPGESEARGRGEEDAIGTGEEDA